MRTVNSPEAAKRLADKKAAVGFEVGGHVVDAGNVIRATPTGKTLITDKGEVFKWRKSRNTFTLRGIHQSNMMVMSRHRIVHRKRPGPKPKEAAAKATPVKKAKRGRPRKVQAANDNTAA